MALELGNDMTADRLPVPVKADGTGAVRLTLRVRSNTVPSHATIRYECEEPAIVITAVVAVSPSREPFGVANSFTRVTRRLSLQRDDASVLLARVKAFVQECDDEGGPLPHAPEQECALQLSFSQ